MDYCKRLLTLKASDQAKGQDLIGPGMKGGVGRCEASVVSQLKCLIQLCFTPSYVCVCVCVSQETRRRQLAEAAEKRQKEVGEMVL